MAGALALVQDDNAKRRVPQAQLAQPLAQHGGRAHDDGGAEATRVLQAGQERRDLDGLTEAHLVADDAARALRVQLPQPLDACAYRQHLKGGPGPEQPASRLSSLVSLLAVEAS